MQEDLMKTTPDHATPLLSIILIGYNSKPFLKHCLKGVEHQTLKNIETFFIDNHSTDDSVSFVEKHFPWVKIIANPHNSGYVGGANQGINLTKSKYVMILNPDLVMPSDYLKKIVTKLETDERIAAITGKVLKYDFETDKPTDIIDTTGLYCFRNRRVIDRGQGLKDEGQYDEEEEVFGVSGAVPVYRREALEDVRLPMLTKERLKDADHQVVSGDRHAELFKSYRSRGNHSSERREPLPIEVLDEDFFMYKEDIDLSWRLRLRGWKCYYYPQAVCYHGRGTGVLKRFTHWEVYKGRKNLSRFAKYYAYKNQRLMQVKNELWPNLVKDFLWVVPKEILILGYIFVREPYLLKAWLQFWIQLPHALQKRRLIMKRRKVGWRAMDYWLSGKAKP